MSKKNINLTNKIEVIPLIAVIAIIPLVVRAKLNLLGLEIANFWIDSKSLDLFSYNKAVGIIIIAISIIGILFLTLKKEKLYLNKKAKLIIILLSVFALFTILSTMNSEYKHLAMWGAPERYEGMFILLVYILLFFYSIYIFRDGNINKYIKYAMLFLATVLSVVGISQIIGKDLINSKFLLNLIVPNEYKNLIQEKVVMTESVYLTLQNSNYVGSYAGIMIPFLIMIVASSYEKLYLRIIAGLLTIATLAILVASKAQSGIVAIMAAIMFMVFIFFKIIIKKPKWIFSIGSIFIAIIIGINVFSNGLLLDKTVDIFSEAGKLLKKSETPFEPTYGAYAYNISFEGNNIFLETKDGKITITINADYTLDFRDENGKNISYKIEPEMGYVLSKPYDKISLGFSEGVNRIIAYKENYEAIEQAYPPTLNIMEGKLLMYRVLVDEYKGLQLVDFRYNEIETIEADHWGFEGKEMVGSSRAYIWSRTIPLLKNTIILGNGPDTFLAYFPQNELLAKAMVYANPNMITDKAHNMYLQFALNNGIVATVALCIAWGIYFIDSLKLYALKKKYSELDYFGIACFLSFIGYMSAGMFNDSTVLVSPIYWVLFGCGVATNQILRRRKLTDGE